MRIFAVNRYCAAEGTAGGGGGTATRFSYLLKCAYLQRNPELSAKQRDEKCFRAISPAIHFVIVQE